ncbi:MAG TPA: pyruvate:ferredoxin (flavodoxin) oxidoreductase, partial [Dissulfurispiraceae bacterium]
DHSDVMAARSTGFAMLCSGSVQEAMDFALIAQAATLESRVPFMHFFDGFRTSHEIRKIEELSFGDMRAMIGDDLVLAHRMRGLSPDRPMARGTAQDPDVYFQGRETVNRFYNAVPGIVQKTMDRFAGITGRQYRLFEYYGHPEAERVAVVLGSAGEVLQLTVDELNARSEKLGVIQVRLYRPFSVEALAHALPASVKAISVLDRTKEPGAIGEPLYLDVRTAVGEAMERRLVQLKDYPRITGGRYGLGSKEFTPAMAKAVFDNLAASEPKNHFTVGIEDDVTHTSLAYDESFRIEGEGMYRALFYGLGADGTVGANKDAIKIIGTETDNYVQAYFVYDSKKSGSVTVSHLRFGEERIRNPYLVLSANFIACHNPSFLERLDMLSQAEEGAVFLLTTPYGEDKVWDTLPVEVQEQLIARKMRFYTIDAFTIANDIGLGTKINMIMQTAFFVISGILPKEEAVASLKEQIRKTYGKKGSTVVEMNYAAVDKALQSISEVPVPGKVTGTKRQRPPVPENAPEFIKKVNGAIIARKGNTLPVSVFPVDGAWPTGVTQYEKRNIGVMIPIWEPQICIQCALCSFVCPHATIRIKAYDPSHLKDAPRTFKSIDAAGKELKGLKFTVQVAPEDCTGCGSCVFVCPAYGKDSSGRKIPGLKAINLKFQDERCPEESKNYDFFMSLPELDQSRDNPSTVKGSQFRRPLFEYHSACAGCGETPYIRLLSQLFGDRLLIANATGCSSIYTANLPGIAYTVRPDGRGPAWSNSLFEDNAEFGFGMRQTVDFFRAEGIRLVEQFMKNSSYADLRGLFEELIGADQSTQQELEDQRARVAKLKERLAADQSSTAKRLHFLSDYMVKKSVWAIGGDGWAYDIGYGGVDHVLASQRNINLLVLDTEVYSNTGGQTSKATPISAVAQFAAGGKRSPKKSLGLIMSTYGNIYIAQVAFGANPAQTVKAFTEAEAFDGPSLIVAYATCIAQGFNLAETVEHNRKAVACGHWPLFRHNPDLEKQGKSPFVLDSGEPTISFEEYARNENRFRMLMVGNPELAARLMKKAEDDIKRRWKYLTHLAKWEPG